MWYTIAKEAARAQKTHNETETTEQPRTTDGETKHDNIRPNTPPDNGQNRDGMNRPHNVRLAENETEEAA